MQNQINLEHFTASHIGHREENQDRFLVLEDPQNQQYLFLIVDGMGGHKGGAQAAQCVVDACTSVWEQTQYIENIESFLNELVKASHDAVTQLNKLDFPLAQSTMAALFMDDKCAVSVHVGDCRVMQFTNSEFVKRTLDQSLAQLHALQGKIEDKDIANHPDQNKVYSSIGGAEEPSPQIENFDEIGNTFVICSDGFWEMYETQDMLKLAFQIQSSNDLENGITEQIANHPKHDNTTAIVVKRLISEPDTGSFSTPKTTSNLLLITGLILILSAIILFFTLPEENGSHTQTSQSQPPEPEEIPSSDVRGNEQVGERPMGAADVEIPSTRLSLDINVEGLNQATTKIDELLRQRGELGADDRLAVTKHGDKLGESEIIRQQQVHKGIPVYGAQVLSIIKDGKLVSVEGKTLADISVDIEPSLTLDEALKIAEEELAQGLTPLNKGSLIILKQANRYLLVWMITVEKTDTEHVILMIHAHNGSVIESISLLTLEEL